MNAGTRRAYGSYGNRVVDHWGSRCLDEPSPSEIRQLMAYAKAHVVARRNVRGGRGAEERLVAALLLSFSSCLLAPTCRSRTCSTFRATR